MHEALAVPHHADAILLGAAAEKHQIAGFWSHPATSAAACWAVETRGIDNPLAPRTRFMGKFYVSTAQNGRQCLIDPQNRPGESR